MSQTDVFLIVFKLITDVYVIFNADSKYEIYFFLSIKQCHIKIFQRFNFITLKLHSLHLNHSSAIY